MVKGCYVAGTQAVLMARSWFNKQRIRVEGVKLRSIDEWPHQQMLNKKKIKK